VDKFDVEGYKTGDIYLSYGDDEYPEFSSAHNDSVLAIKTHTFSASSSDDFQFRRALVRFCLQPTSKAVILLKNLRKFIVVIPVRKVFFAKSG